MVPSEPGGPDQRRFPDVAVTVRQRIAGASPAMKFVVMVGIMSFFADFTYEGSRSIIGPYLGLLGAGAFAISVISGAGEFLGYGLRLFSGRGVGWESTIPCKWGWNSELPEGSMWLAGTYGPFWVIYGVLLTLYI